jgi:hypothetical protein
MNDVVTMAQVAVGGDQAAAASEHRGMMTAGHALVVVCQMVTAEVLAFWQSRLKEGLGTGHRLLECRSPEGALEIQLDYAKAALQAYVDQAAKIATVTVRSLTVGFGAIDARSG